MRRLTMTLLLAFILLLPSALCSQVTVRIDVPPLVFDVAQQQYAPYPMKVTLTVRNPDTIATKTISVRIELLPAMEMDTSEHGVTIKSTVPAVAGPHDSAKVSWFLVHPPTLAGKIQRVTFWVKFGANDSASYAKNITIPVAGPPVLSISANAVPHLTVIADSSGYIENPFEVRFRLVNVGQTPADSMRVKLKLPPFFVLDPPTQSDSIFIPSLKPIPPGDPRFEIHWTVRYLYATRLPVTDTLRVEIRAKDMEGGPVLQDLFFDFGADGLSPTFDLSLLTPDSLQYDSATTYSPHPFPVTVVVTNLGLQVASLQNVDLSIVGADVTTVEPRSQPIGTLLPGGQWSFQWNAKAGRAPATRVVHFQAEVADADARKSSTDAAIVVPGKPYALRIVDIQFPDSLPLNAARTDFVQNTFDLRFRVRNDFWANTTLIRTIVDYLPAGISPPGPLDETHAEYLPADGTSQEFRHAFTAMGQPFGRTIPLQVTAISSLGDTGRAARSVYIPGITPTMQLIRTGVDSLRYDPIKKYTPNPFEQRFTAVNTTTYSVRIDSVVLVWSGDSILSSDPTSYAYGTYLKPGDSLQVPWIFRAVPSDLPRLLTMRATIYFEGQFSASRAATVFIPALAPNLEPTIVGETDLRYDSVYTYKPNPFIRRIIFRNTGTAPIQIDSIVLSYQDAKLTTINPLRIDYNLNLVPGDSIAGSWTFTALKRDEDRTVPIVITLYYAGGKILPLSADVTIPGRKTELRIIDLGVPSNLMLRPDGSDYLINPFATSFRVFNDSWIRVLLTATRVSIDDPSLVPWTPLVRTPNSFLYPAGTSEVRIDSFWVKPSFADRTVTFTFIAEDSFGNLDTATAAMFLPALTMTGLETLREVHGFEIEGVYPNPVTPGDIPRIRVSAQGTDNVRVELLDVFGRVMETALVQGPSRNTVITMAERLRPGMYLVRLKNGTIIRQMKFVVLGR